MWVPIENSTEPSAFEEYLAGDPQGHFAELARAALRQRIERADKDALDGYLARYPSGAAADLARERLPAVTWESIRDNTQPRVFEEYLAAYPESRFAESCRAALRQRIERADKDALDDYLARYPSGWAAGLARERLPWATAKESSDFRVFWDYLQQYPGSVHDAEARQRLSTAIDESTDVDALDELAREQPTSAFARQARQRTATLAWGRVAHSLRASDFDDFLRQYPDSREVSLVPSAKAALEHLVATIKAKFSFNEKDGIWVGKDCKVCPEMVVVPAGSYRMGSANGQGDERPVHEVTIASPFAVGKYEVTFAEWDACARDRACPREKGIIAADRGWGRGQRPVIFVSWDDAQRYVRWLSEKTNKHYRLLSESEWEYAARAGTETAYSWGDEIGVSRANCDGCGSQWDDRQTAPVGSFAANAWGLHDMHGNVSEWVEDCWNDSYAGSPRDGSAWRSGDCSERVLRGGSWILKPSYLRAAYRLRDTTGNRNFVFGFRVARTLTP